MKNYKEENNTNKLISTITYDIGKFIEEHSEYYHILEKDFMGTSGNVIDMIASVIFEQGKFIERDWRNISGI